MIDTPRRPADAYYAVAALMPRTYFTTPPPAAGVRLTVTGRDGVATRWDMNEHLAEQLATALTTQYRHLQLGAVAYDDPDRTQRPGAT